MPAARCAATAARAMPTGGSSPPPSRTGRRSISTPSSRSGRWTAWTGPSPTSRSTARSTPTASWPTTRRARSVSSPGSTARFCCTTPRPSSPTAASSAWARRSASPPAACTPEDQWVWSSSPPSSTWCAAPVRCGRAEALSGPARRRLRVAFARLDPTLLAAGTLLLLPEGRPGLEVVHQELGGGKGGLAVRRGRDHQHDVVAGQEPADTVHDQACLQRPAPGGLGLDAGQLGFRHAGIVLERHGRDAAGGALATHGAGEGDDGTDVGAAGREAAHLGADVEVVLLYPHGHRSAPRHRWEEGDFARARQARRGLDVGAVDRGPDHIGAGERLGVLGPTALEPGHQLRHRADAGRQVDDLLGLAGLLAHPGKVENPHGHGQANAPWRCGSQPLDSRSRSTASAARPPTAWRARSRSRPAR